MDKILKPYTIIPEELYIQREADIQVRNIISNMGRPGYVLVSRQMGKTNLLIYAKKQLETEKDAFVYIDLSNTFPTPKGCFENIIDNAIDAYPEKFSLASKVIQERRNELKDVPPHKQHTNELRILLQALNGGKMVIILDEIDALTKTNYSDQIFSQIRSTYFGSRVNYNEFYNLTYLLSGVVEPTEIIKDTKVSPFNIGQKIYLNDFTREEFNQFINTAKLKINTDCSDRIFYWTNGNPRITWDICSEVEDKLVHGECYPDLIDKIVQELYLTSFDKAPIDNIREIVTNDREIRNSIVEIEYNKGKHVSSRVKSKLYLAGIINYDDEDIHIKNEVIRKSLSFEWLRSLEEADKGLLGLALENYNNGKYLEAIGLFENYLTQKEFPENNRDIYYYYMGFSLFELGNYEKALEYFNKTNFDIDESPKMHFATSNLTGIAYRKTKQYDKSKDCYTYIIENGIRDDTFLRASLNLGHLYMNSYLGDRTDEAIILFEDIIHDKLSISNKVKDLVINEIKGVATYNLATIYKSEGNHIKAEKYIRNILPKVVNDIKSSLLLLLTEVISDREEKVSVLVDLIDKASEKNNDQFSNSLDRTIGLEIFNILDVFINLFEIDKNIFNNITTNKIDNYSDKPRGEFLFEIAVHSINKNRSEVGVNLLQDLYDENKQLNLPLEPLTKYNTLKLLAYFLDYETNIDIPIEYITYFERERLSEIDFLDLSIFINLIYTFIERKDSINALSYIGKISSFENEVSEEIAVNFLVIHNFELNIYMQLKSVEKAADKAQQLLNLLDNNKYEHVKSIWLGEKGVERIRTNVETTLVSLSKSIGSINHLKGAYERNQLIKVKYKNGKVVIIKFKKVADDIARGKCIILE